MVINFEEIKRRRLEKGLTFGEAAQRAGWPKVGRSRWCDIEMGRRKTLTVDTIVDVAAALECSVTDLINDGARKDRRKENLVSP